MHLVVLQVTHFRLVVHEGLRLQLEQLVRRHTVGDLSHLLVVQVQHSLHQVLLQHGEGGCTSFKPLPLRRFIVVLIN